MTGLIPFVSSSITQFLGTAFAAQIFRMAAAQLLPQATPYPYVCTPYVHILEPLQPPSVVSPQEIQNIQEALHKGTVPEDNDDDDIIVISQEIIARLINAKEIWRVHDTLSQIIGEGVLNKNCPPNSLEIVDTKNLSVLGLRTLMITAENPFFNSLALDGIGLYLKDFFLQLRIRETLRRNPNIVKLSLSKNSEPGLTLSGVLEGLVESNVRDLTLYSNALGGPKLDRLLTALQYDCKLEALDLTDNGLTDQDLARLAYFFREGGCPNIKKLDLGYDDFILYKLSENEKNLKPNIHIPHNLVFSLFRELGFTCIPRGEEATLGRG